MRKLSFWMIASMLFLIGCNNEAKKDDAAATEPATTETKQQPAEIADAKYMAIGKQGLANMSAGNVDGWAENWADNIVWHWNNGDSIAGKATVVAYWKNRRANDIDSITFTNEIWLPVQVNRPQATEAAGIWLLGWYTTKAKYKTGKSMTQGIHAVQHFNSNDKIDIVFQYLDRTPINAAMKK